MSFTCFSCNSVFLHTEICFLYVSLIFYLNSGVEL